MARQTRSERRARRAAQAESRAAVERAPQRQPQPARPPAAETPKPASEGRRPPGGGIRRFVSESWGELQKVEWPTQNQLIQGVVVVLIACLVVGVFLWGADLVFKRLVENVLLR